MAKLDKYNRISPPKTFLEIVGFCKLPQDVAICFEDSSSTEVYLWDANKLQDTDNVLDVRRMDDKGRVIFTKEVRSFLHYNENDYLTLYIRNSRLYIKINKS